MWKNYCRLLNLKKNVFIYRNYSIKNDNKPIVKYTSTINLPQTKFPPRLNGTKRTEVENRINEVCGFLNNFLYKELGT